MRSARWGGDGTVGRDDPTPRLWQARLMESFPSITRTSGSCRALPGWQFCCSPSPRQRRASCAAKGDHEVEKVRAAASQGHPRRTAEEGRAPTRAARGRDQARAGGDVEETALVVTVGGHPTDREPDL